MTSGCADALPVLLEGAQQLSLALSAEQQHQFEEYCALLQEWGEHTNLTAVRTPDGIMRTLFLDALSLIPIVKAVCDRPDSLQAVDVGAGAGLPSLPLKLLFPDWSLALVESVGKKARFLRAVVDGLGLDGVEVHARRAEELARQPDFRDAFDLAVARAVSALPSLLELCGPFVRVGGRLILPKAGAVESEIERAREAERRLGLRLLRTDDIHPGLRLGEGRKVVIYEKIRPTPNGYPRRAGLAQSKPIGGHVSPNAGTAPSDRVTG